MKRLFAGAFAALAICGLAGCGSGTANDVNSAPTQTVAEDASLRAKACDAYQGMGERQLRQSETLRESMDKSLSAEQRADAQRRLDAILADKSVYDANVNPDECSGPIWEKYHASVIQNSADITATSAAMASVAETGVTNWKYLQSEYSKFLGLNCGNLNAAYQATCLGLQNAGIDSFARDAEELPKSKARSDVLGAIERYKENHDTYTDARCEMSRTQSAGCITASLGMSLTYDSIVSIVNREAAAQ
ncbi:hypothetical protein CJ178_28435 [Rhodococcus sp. ACPA4]|uniref:hypothetical protein n=1 Tax=Rhodococcus TaxID=1827 RepID=UPI000BB0E6E9|nr:hypothetical protein [Rhodococcus sp. ACPA4]PBC37947.1 hypothetical protein CJ178_28435 [Rhodococcus sp. ACPA4]